ncbi:MAG: hypothetical protein HRU69_08940 [Flammeovirgaceae bacterium]|nr:MAG: hypothetical protein HRU69_08940 [Flammeovirgaceae bacterium]
MNFKPDEGLLMAYLYGELGTDEKRRVEEYLAGNPEALKEVQALQHVRKGLSAITDKEIIPPPMVWGSSGHRFWHDPYIKTSMGIAATITLLVMVGWLTGLNFRLADGELHIGFGKPVEKPESLTAQEVQRMIAASLQENNRALAADWASAEQRLTESIRHSLASNMLANRDALIKQVASATHQQVRDYVSALQEENARMMKDYLTLSANEQQQVIEELLIDFSRYLNQQRTTDLQTLQTRLTAIEQNTDLFKQETEQILTSIIASVEGGNTKEIRN